MPSAESVNPWSRQRRSLPEGAVEASDSIDPASAHPSTPEAPRAEPSDPIYLPPPAIAPEAQEFPVAAIPADAIDAVVPSENLVSPNTCNNPVAQRLYREDGSHFLGVKCDDGVCRDIWGNETLCDIVPPVAAHTPH